MIRILFLLLFIGNADPTEIAKINRLKAQAEEAFLNGDYNIAAVKYSMLYDSMGVEEEEIALNLAHCYYATGDSSNARINYQNLTTSSDKKLKSVAYQQLGVMAKTPSTLKQSLAYLKAALKADPSNEEARYNYEVVKKLLKEQEEQQQQNEDQQNKEDQNKEDQQKKENKQQEESDQNKPGEEGEESEEQDQDQPNEDQQQKDGEQKDQQEGKEGEEEQQQPQEGEQSEDDADKQDQLSTQQKLEEMNISEEKAQMILEAMKNNEVQYIQQQKRKATQPRESGKPDW